MNFLRWIVGLPFAAVVTAGLFFMMAGLIGQDEVDVPDATPYPDVNIHAKISETPPDRPKPPKPTQTDPPEIIIPPAGRQEEPGPIIREPTPTPIGPTPDGSGGAFPKPVIKYPPQYPENCRSRAAEGTVTVQFNISPEGNPVNIRILESANSCFNRTVIRTVSKWKYPPTTRNGRAVTRHGVIEVIRFELEELGLRARRAVENFTRRAGKKPFAPLADRSKHSTYCAIRPARAQNIGESQYFARRARLGVCGRGAQKCGCGKRYCSGPAC